jgi:hypothetical protein
MLRLTLASSLLLLACGGRSEIGSLVLGEEPVDGAVALEDAGPDAPVFRFDSGLDAATPPDAATAIHFSAGGHCNDYVSLADEGVYPDGVADGCLKSFFDAPVDGLILVTTDAQGNPCCGQEWDTLVETDMLPQSQFGLLFGAGFQTPVLGILAGPTTSGAKLANDSKGRLSSPVKGGLLVMTDTGYFHTGTHLRLYGHVLASEYPTWEASNVVTWP